MSSSNQESRPPEREIRIRYKLVNAKDGTPYRGATPAAAFVRWPADVDIFRVAVHAKEIWILKEFAPCQLLVYSNGSSDEKIDVSPDPKNLLDPFRSLVEVGNDENHAPLLVAVPSTESPMHSARNPPDVRSPEIGRSGLSSEEWPTPQQAHKKLREMAEGPRIPKTANPPFLPGDSQVVLGNPVADEAMDLSDNSPPIPAVWARVFGQWVANEERVVHYHLHRYTRERTICSDESIRSSITLKGESPVFHLNNLLMKQHPDFMKTVRPSDLEVYKEEIYLQGGVPMMGSALVQANLGIKPSEPIIIVAPWRPVIKIELSDIPIVRGGKLFRRSEGRRSSPFFLVKKEWLQHSGIGKRKLDSSDDSLDTWLFIRGGCESQLEFMSKIYTRCEDRNPPRAIYGQPGTGKSMIAFVFCLSESVHNNKIILWIHLKMSKDVYNFVIMHGAEMRAGISRDLKCLTEFIESDWGISDNTSARLLVLDGFINNETSRAFRESGYEWRSSNRELRTLFFVSSMAGAPEVVAKDDKDTTQARKFLQVPWSFEDYKNALENDEFRNGVARVLKPGTHQATTMTKAEAEAALKDKFFYAGGCARYMFQFDTNYVKGELEELLARCNLNIMVDALTGASSTELTHGLVSLLPGDRHEPISQFVRTLISEKLGKDRLLKILTTIPSNNSVKGWVFEEYFFHALRESSDPFSLHQNEANDNELKLGKKNKEIHFFDPDDPTLKCCPVDRWLRPRRFNQAGFDGLLLKTIQEGGVSAIFAQCTVSDKHEGWHSACFQCLKKIKEILKYKIVKMKFYFIVPEDHLEIFTLRHSAPLPRNFFLRRRPDPQVLAIQGFNRNI